MSAYLIPLKTAIIVFFVLANVFSIPFLIWEYHKKGALTFFKGFIIYSFCFYLMTAFFMTLLPLPTIEHVEALTSPYAQLIPFMFVKDIMRESVLVISDTSTYIPALMQNVFLQVIFNVVLTIPFGIYLRYYFKQDFKRVLLFTFLMSLFYEVTQITGIYGIYPRPYRLFDVDDLMLNTLGGVVGYYITPALVFLFPSRAKIEQHVIYEANKIPILRRVLAYLIDYQIIKIVINVISFDITLNKYLESLLIAFSLSIIYYLFDGTSIGLKLLNLKIVTKKNNKLTFKQSFKRAFYFIGATSIVFTLSNEIFNIMNNVEFESVWPLLLYLIISLSLQLIFALHLIIVGILKRAEMFHEKLSKTKLISTLER